MVNYFFNFFLIHHIEKNAKPGALFMIKKNMHLVMLPKEGNFLHIHSIMGQPLLQQEIKLAIQVQFCVGKDGEGLVSLLAYQQEKFTELRLSHTAQEEGMISPS